MTTRNSEKPYSSVEQDKADDACRKLPNAFGETPRDKQEAYVDAMVRRDRELERMNDC